MIDYSNMVAALASQCPSAKVNLAEDSIDSDMKGVTVEFKGYIILVYSCNNICPPGEIHWLVDLIDEDGDTTSFDMASELAAAFKAINLYRAYI